MMMKCFNKLVWMAHMSALRLPIILENHHTSYHPPLAAKTHQLVLSIDIWRDLIGPQVV